MSELRTETDMDSYKAFLDSDIHTVVDQAMLADLQANQAITLEPGEIINAYSFVKDVEFWHRINK